MVFFFCLIIYVLAFKEILQTEISTHEIVCFLLCFSCPVLDLILTRFIFVFLDFFVIY